MNQTLHRMMRATFGVMIVALLLSASTAHSQITQLSQYIFSAGIGTPTDMSGAATAIGTNNDDVISGTYNIGFNFVFCGTTYSTFSVSSNGYMGLGGNTSNYLSGCFNSATMGVPYIAGFWRDLYTANGGVTYLTTGSAPSRILTVQWSCNACCSGGAPGTQFQVRLYEGSNKFDMWYGASNVSCGTIGAAVSTSNWASVTTPSSVSYTSCNSCNNSPAVNTVYTFSQCNVTFTGNVAQGGTSTMASGDILLTNQSIQRGNVGSYQPFTITGPGCGPTTLTFTISGTAAADYSITPASQTISSAAPYTPTIMFNPTGNGQRTATLTITGPGVSQVYILKATATTRIQFTGNIPQGGTAAMANGDTLMKNIVVTRGTPQGFTPFTLTNFNTNGSAPGAVITYAIKGTSGGQYSITSSSVLTAGQSVSPVITFAPTGVGLILDTLTVNAEGDIRVYALRANSLAPGGAFTINSVPLDSNSNLFNNLYGCLGEEVVTYPLNIASNGFGAPLIITGIEYYTLDTTYRQGQPKYAFVRDAQGRLVRSNDYALTLNPTVYPIGAPANALTFPITYPAGVNQPAYFSFIAQQPGKRFTKVLIRTNAQNIYGRDTNGVLTQGLLSFDLYARGRNASLSDNVSGGLPKAVTFPNTKVGESSTKNVTLVNAGACSLRVSMKDLEIIAGDQKEFKIISMPTTNLDANGDLLLAPGVSNTGIVVKFTPMQTGSRRATLALLTNDSTIVVPGVTRRGVYYMDLYGFSPAILSASNLDLGTALIGGTGADQNHGVIHLENNSNTNIDIKDVVFLGTDMGDFSADPTHPWPTNTTIAAGDRLDLGVTFAPAGTGTPGPRTVKVVIHFATGDSTVATVTAVAGTRTLTANPQSLNFSLSLARGQYARQTITITNTGTMAVTLSEKPKISGAAASDFSVGMLPRLELQPGQSEYLEVTYHATSAGTSSASLTILSNQTGGPLTVSLNGTATKTRRDVNDIPTATTGGGHDGVLLHQRDEVNLNVAGVDGEVSTDGMALRQNVPNPTRDQMTISYRLADRSDVTLSLYDGNGRLVKVLDAGVRESGEQTVRVNVSDLASGVYHYRLVSNGRVLDRTMQVVK